MMAGIHRSRADRPKRGLQGSLGGQNRLRNRTLLVGASLMRADCANMEKSPRAPASILGPKARPWFRLPR